MANGYKYDAFISYRHAELDKFVAENLHKKLESYKISKKVLSNGRARRSKIERVFRDKDELPITNNLEDPIIKALSDSEYLLVICTPRLKESVWCKKEIETFIGMHGRNKIFAVLAEGEPHESFPEEILYREEQVMNPDGTLGTQVVPAEPLAADVRGKNKKEILRAMDIEVLRLLAPMLGVDFDDLKQRHRERKFKKIITATVAAAVMFLGIGIASTITALHINKQKEQIEAQAVEIQAQADEIASQSDAIATQNEQLLNIQAKSMAENSLKLLENGDREAAVDMAVSSLTAYDGIDMPYTPEGQYALTKALRVYDCGVINKPYMTLRMTDIIVSYKLSYDGMHVAAIDESGNMSIFNLQNGKKLYTAKLREPTPNSDYYAFLDNNTIVYADENTLYVYDFINQNMISTCQINSTWSVTTAYDSKYYVSSGIEEITIYDRDTHQQVGYLTLEEGGHFDSNMLITEDNKLIFSQEKNTDIETVDINKKGQLVHIYDIAAKEYISSIETDDSIIESISYKDENVYFLGVEYYIDVENVFGDNGDNTTLVKYNCNDKEIVWERNITSSTLDTINLPFVDNGHIMINDDRKIYMVNDESGDIVSSYVMGDDIVSTATYLSIDMFAIFDDKGLYYVVEPGYAEPIVHSDMFEQNFTAIKSFDIPAEGFIVHPQDDVKLVIYMDAMSKDANICEASELDEEKVKTEENPALVAANFGIEDSDLVKHVFYSNDDTKMFIAYENGRLDIYSSAEKKLIKSVEGLNDVMSLYYGEDSSGNTYISGYGYGYILDKDFNPVAEIENMKNVDFDNNKLIIQNYSDYYEVPIYSLEELIELGTTD